MELSPWIADLDLKLVVETKYDRPAKAEERPHASEMPACIFTEGVTLLTWNLEIKMRSNMMLTANLIELMISGTLGLSNARVEVLTAYSIAELNAEKAAMRTHVTLADRTSTGTNLCVKVDAPATKPILMISPGWTEKGSGCGSAAGALGRCGSSRLL